MRKNNVNKRKNNKLVVILMVILTVAVLSGCKKDNKPHVIIDDAPAVTETPTVEVTPEPTDEPEVTPVPTEEPEVEVTPTPTEDIGVDINSDLPGEEWVSTFIGVVEEPQIVIINDETGRKEIVEENTKVTFNPEKDTFVVYLPEGYKFANRVMGLEIKEIKDMDFGHIFVLDSEKTRESKFKEVAVYVMNGEEESKIEFILKSE